MIKHLLDGQHNRHWRMFQGCSEVSGHCENVVALKSDHEEADWTAHYSIQQTSVSGVVVSEWSPG